LKIAEIVEAGGNSALIALGSPDLANGLSVAQMPQFLADFRVPFRNETLPSGGC
jgi:hypothetical protein